MSVCQLYLRYPCCSSMNFDPSPVDKYNSVNSSNSGCNLKLSIVERLSKEVQIVNRLFLLNCYLLHGNIYSETEADRDRSI